MFYTSLWEGRRPIVVGSASCLSYRTASHQDGSQSDRCAAGACYLPVLVCVHSTVCIANTYILRRVADSGLWDPKMTMVVIAIDRAGS